MVKAILLLKTRNLSKPNGVMVLLNCFSIKSYMKFPDPNKFKGSVRNFHEISKYYMKFPDAFSVLEYR